MISQYITLIVEYQYPVIIAKADRTIIF